MRSPEWSARLLLIWLGTEKLMPNPPHPGEFIRETYIEPFEISVRSLAESLGVSPSTLEPISKLSVAATDNYEIGSSQNR
jgi:hypothetical protein